MNRITGRIFILGVTLCMALSSALAAEPKPEDFVTIKDGHLHRHGKRVRYWATNLLFAGDKHHKEKYSTNYESIDAGIERLKKFGYNAVRYWARGLGDFENYKKGDCSKADYSDYFLARLKQEGFVVWQAGLNDRTDPRMVTAADVEVIDDPSTTKAWIAAISEEPRALGKYRARAWDPRLRKLNLLQVKRYLDHYNQYTGLHAYEDPVYAVWELTNEEWWAPNMLRGDWAKEPEFFRQELIQQWNDWLKKKYKTTEALVKAWSFLREGESLEESTVAFAPMSTAGVDVQAATLGAGNLAEGEKLTLTKKDFTHARSEDVMQFFLEMSVAYKKEIEAFIRSYGKKGIGCQIVPVLWDTGMTNQMPSAYMHAQAAATSAGCYVRGIRQDAQDPRFPWRSALLEAPKLYYDNPWLEQNRIEGKPFFIYEFNVFNPAKYRAEIPYMLATLGSIQDWDWISWYQFDGFRRIDKEGDPNPYGRPMNYEYDSHYWNGVYYIFDEVLQASMLGAGEIFKNFAAQPVKTPTVFTFGKKALYDMEMQHYEGKYERGRHGSAPNIAAAFGPTTWRFGSRIAFDPAGDFAVKIDGPIIKDSRFLTTLVKPTDQITIDWKSGYLQVDSPTAKAVGGFLPEQWKFSDGVTLENIHVHNPAGQPYVIPGERFAVIYLVAEDAKPLPKSKQIVLTAASTSFREDFSVNADAVNMEKLSDHVWSATYKELFRYEKMPNGRPVRNLVSRVGLSVHGAFLKGKSWKMYDWHLNVIDSGTVVGDEFVLPADKDATYVVFESQKEN